MTDITVPLTPGHIEAFCATYGAPAQAEKQTDDDYATTCLTFATNKIRSFADEVRDAFNITVKVNDARKSAITENAGLEKSDASAIAPSAQEV